MDIHTFFSVANTEITMHSLIVWGYFSGYGKWRNGNIENYSQ